MHRNQLLAERGLKKRAWRGIGDQVVREFDSVFSAKGKKGAAPQAQRGGKRAVKVCSLLLPCPF